MKRLLFAILMIAGLPVFAQSPTKAVKTNASDVLVEPTATALWTANPLVPTFITQTPSTLLQNEQALSSMSTGLLSVTTGTGNLTSVSDSAGLRTAISDETGTGGLVFANTPTLITPALGVATATSINGLTISTGTGTLAIANGKTLTASNTLTFTGTDSSSINFGTGGTAAYTGATLAQFANTTSAELAGIITNETGSGALAFATSPTLVTPNIGVATATSINGLTVTASTGTLTITNGKTLSSANTLSFSGTDSANVNFAAGGTVGYTSGTLGQFSSTTSLQLKDTISDETGSGALVFASSPTLVTPVLGAATATTINGLTITSSTGTLSITSGKTLAATNSLTFSGTDGSTLNIGSGGVLGALAFANSISASDGGTGISSYAVGDLLTANGTSSLTRISAVATGNALISQGIATVPVWGKITTAHTTGIAASGANADIQSIAPPDGTLDVTGGVTSTVTGATEVVAGTIQQSTTGEARSMTDDTTAMSPADVGAALNYATASNLTADDETIVVGTSRTILLTSNSATAANRTFEIDAPSVDGADLALIWDESTGDKAEFLPTNTLSPISNVYVFQNLGDALYFKSNAGKWVFVSAKGIDIYSSSESEIGQWVDGSPLYRKTVNVGALPNATSSNDAHGISGGSFGGSSIRRIYGYATNGTITRPIPFASTTASNSIDVSATTTNVVILTGIDWSSYSGYVTLEYTK